MVAFLREELLRYVIFLYMHLYLFLVLIAHVFFIDLSFYRILKIWLTVWYIEFNLRGFGKCVTVFAIAICLTSFKSR